MSDTASLSPQFFIDTLPARKILENAADFVALITPDGQILDINENGRMLMSIWDEIELADLTIVDLTAEAYQTLQQETALPTAIQEGSWQGEVVYQSRDGIEVPISQKIVGGFNLDEKPLAHRLRPRHYRTQMGRNLPARKRNPVQKLL